MIVHDVEQRSPEWFDLHIGVPSSYQFSRLVSPTGKASTQALGWGAELAGEKYLGRPLGSFGGNSHTDRGNELEPYAIDYYQEATGNVVKPVGFITDDLMRYGCSTDGLTEDDSGKGGVEAKCLSNKNHLFALLNYLRTKGTPADYKPQVQGEIMIAELDWIDMVFYHPEYDSFIVRKYADEKFQELLKKQLAVCLKEKNEAYKLLTGEK